MKVHAVALIVILSVCLCEAFLPGISSKLVRNVLSVKQNVGWTKVTPLFLTTADFKNGMTIELGMWKISWYETIEYHNRILIRCRGSTGAITRVSAR